MRRTLTAILISASSSAFADQVELGSFSIDRTEVTIADFADFAERTGLSTTAERSGGGF